MTVHLRKKPVLFLALGIAAGVLLAGPLAALDINKLPPDNWTVPKPTGIHTMADATPPRAFIGLPPCRIVDTRGNGAPIQGGRITGGADVRNYALPGICGVPAGVVAVSLNFTVVGPSADGFFVSWPTGGAPPPVSILNFTTGSTVANAAIVPTNTGTGSITVNSSAATDLLVDINGYFSEFLGTPGNVFRLTNNTGAETMVLTNNSTTCTGACGLFTSVAHGTAIDGFSVTTGDGVFGISADASGAGVHGRLTASVFGSAAVLGEHLATGPAGIGVVGSHSGTGFGVFGTANGTTGFGAIGVLGDARSNSDGSVGVEGEALATTGITYGVYGHTDSQTAGAAGVLGNDGGGRVPGAGSFFGAAGVRGESPNHLGVVGVVTNSTGFAGTSGFLLTTAGSNASSGYLGSNFGTAADATGPPWGVFAFGNLGASGAKHFVEPHPTDPNTVILYSSLEGREVGTYFRGTARTVGGVATIQVPEDFRIVTDDEGLTTQLTPVGSAAVMYIVSEDLDTIVVRSSKDVTFHYLIQGVRRAYKDFQPLAKGYEFMPLSADDLMPAHLTEEARRRLISNGTYNADGTVNMSTAERAGWTKIWADRQAAAEAAGRAAAQQRAQQAGLNKPAEKP
jgi:hypothetical protein